jgi:hypothetical protein
MRVRAFDPKLLGLAVRMDAHTASEGLVPRKLKELAQLEGGGHGRVHALNRHSFCRGQKGRDHRGAVVGPGGIRGAARISTSGKSERCG